jgi:nucleotide-binding universal stress UspA family protein
VSTPKSILVPVDFSETSDHALTYALTLAREFGARVHVIHVIPDPHSQAWSISATGLGSLMDNWETDAQRRLDGLDLGDFGGNRLTKAGLPHTEIIRCANSQHVDLIVIGTNGRGGLEHMLLGSVAEKVLRTASCPVVTVRRPRHPEDHDTITG